MLMYGRHHYNTVKQLSSKRKKKLPANAGDTDSIPGPEDSTGPGATKHVCPNY